MKKSFLFVLLIAILLFFIWVMPSIGNTATDKKLESAYSAYIDELSLKCASMAKMRKSKLVNIRREASLNCFKAHFLRTYKDELINDMIADNVGNKRYKMKHYLNEKFFKMLKLAVAGTHHTRNGQNPI